MSDTRPPANLTFSHMGISVRDIALMEKFYVEVLGFTKTDHGNAGGMDLVFLSRDPLDHHQIVLATGRPDEMPGNAINPHFGPSINQISFKLGTIGDLRDIHRRLVDWGVTEMLNANHGVAWSIYAHDPEGNNLEFFVDSEWYIRQPLLNPLDLSLSDDEILAESMAMCEASEGFEPYSAWQARIAAKMTAFVPSGVH